MPERVYRAYAAVRRIAMRQTNAGARQSSLIFVVNGLLVIVAEAVFTPDAPGNFGMAMVCIGAIVLGVVIWLLPWDRWHPRLITVIAPCAFAVIGAANVVQFTPLEYALYFLIVFVWIGLTHGRFVCVAAAPVAFAVYLFPLRLLPEPLAWDVIISSALIVIPISALTGEIVAARVAAMTAAQRESEHRAELLHAVSKACRAISTLDRSAVLAAVADSLAEIGFVASSFTFFIGDGTTYRVEEARSLPLEYERGTHVTAGTLSGRVRERRATLVLQDYSAGDVVHPALAAAQFKGTIATPVWVSGEMVGVLIAATHQPTEFTAQDIEALELLAAQAGRALENARTFQAEVAIRHQLVVDSMRDVLTGIGNRRYAMTLLDSLRTGDSLALIDLDHFKNVNDTYGHAGGDAVLADVGSFLTRALRDGDDVARFGGEEFLLVLRNAGSEATAILQRLTEDWRLLSPRTTFSTGYAVHQRGAHPEETLGNADSALYAAKAAGRDRVLAFVPSQRIGGLDTTTV